jgi:hypothetical protein
VISPFTRLDGVIVKIVISVVLVIYVVIPVVPLSIAFPDESYVYISKELVTLVVLGFFSPLHAIVNGVPVFV